MALTLNAFLYMLRKTDKWQKMESRISSTAWQLQIDLELEEADLKKQKQSIIGMKIMDPGGKKTLKQEVLAVTWPDGRLTLRRWRWRVCWTKRS